MTKRIIGLVVCCFCIGACAANSSPDSSDVRPATGSSSTPTPTPPTAATSPVVTVTPIDGPIANDLPAITKPAFAWSFEPASADCNGWSALGGIAIRASPSRSGSYSCKVCADGSSPSISVSHDLGALASGHYVFTAWVRKRVSTAAPPEANARVDSDSSTGPHVAFTQTVSVREEWDHLDTPIDLSADVTNVRVTVGAPAADVDRCLFIDDVTITRAE